MKHLALFALLATAACGVDGAPVANSASVTTGVTLSGCGSVGVSTAPTGHGAPLC